MVKTTFRACVFAVVLLLLSGFAFALAQGASARTTISPIIATPNLTLNTTTSTALVGMTTTINPAAIDAMMEALKSGPMVYVAAHPALVIDSSTRKAVSTIKPDAKEKNIEAIAVSPDGQYVYVAVSWSNYQDDPYGGYSKYHSTVMRLNASTQKPIDYYSFDDIYP
jgi:DNA-binding beta-propeller fold protein YncE